MPASSSNGDPAARYLSRVIRLCLRFGIKPIFIPPAQPQRNGAVEWFNGWFQSRLFQRHYYTRASALKRELQRLENAVNTQHVQRRLGGLTPDQRRHQQRLKNSGHDSKSRSRLYLSPLAA